MIFTNNFFSGYRDKDCLKNHNTICLEIADARFTIEC